MKRILGMTLGIMLVLLLSVSVALADEGKKSGAFTYQIKGKRGMRFLIDLSLGVTKRG